jgi:membrane protease YdiL (CAAX protease family)
VKRLTQLLRSVLPADPYQLVFLLGVISVFISPRLPWWPSYDSTADEALYPRGNDPQLQLYWKAILALAIWPIVVGSLVAWFTALWPGRRPVRRIVFGVLLPVTAALVFLWWRFRLCFMESASVFDHSSAFVTSWHWFSSHFTSLPGGFHFCIFGPVLIAIFTLRLSTGISSLPVSLPLAINPSQDDSSSWSKTQFLIFTLVGPFFLLASLVGVLMFLATHSWRPLELSTFGLVSTFLSSALGAALLLLVALWILGKESRIVAWKAIQLPELRFVLYAALVPVGISASIGAAQYLIDRAHWAAQDFARLSPPQFSSYFGIAQLWQPWLLSLALGAFAEEIVFRGLLLPALLRRYGIQRGVLLTGIVWAAYHFRSDIYSGLSVGGVLLHLVDRVLICLAMNYVFSWMTLRWRSIIPAAVTHTISNMLVMSGVNDASPWNARFHLMLWIVLACAFFSFWPLDPEETQTNEQPDPGLEPAI